MKTQGDIKPGFEGFLSPQTENRVLQVVDLMDTKPNIA